MIFNNPLIRRYRYSLMRPRQLWVHLIIHISIIVLLLYVNYIAYEYQEIYKSTTKLFISICYQFLILQVVILWIWGAINSGSAITKEITGNSYDFLRMLPLSAGKKAVGILVGKNLIIMLLAVIDFILIIIFGKLGQESNSWLAQSLFFLLSVALLINSVALLSSIKFTIKKKKSNIATLIIIFFFLGPFIIRLVISAMNFRMFKSIKGSFFNIKLPVMILSSLVAIYFSCWSIIGILRKFNKEDEPLFSRTGAYLFMIGYEFVLFGILYTRLTQGARIINYSFWLISLLPILAIPLWSIRSYNNYIEHIGLIHRKSVSSKNVLFRTFLYSNLFLGFGLFVIWAACAIGTTSMAQLDLQSYLYMIFVLLSSYLFLILLLELYVVYYPVSSKVGIFVAVIAAVYFILPLILSDILEIDMLLQISPIGLIIEMFPNPDEEITILNRTWIINLLLCIIPGLLIHKQYSQIFNTRKKMKTNT